MKPGTILRRTKTFVRGPHELKQNYTELVLTHFLLGNNYC